MSFIVAGSRWCICFAFAIACGNTPVDYAPASLVALGVHNSLQYVGDTLMHQVDSPLLLVQPRLAYATIHTSGETFTAQWLTSLAPNAQFFLQLTDDDVFGELELIPSGQTCDAHNLCQTTLTVPPIAVGLYGLCVEISGTRSCSPHAIAVVDHYNEPVNVIHISDVHAGADSSTQIFGSVVDAINKLSPPPDVAIFTGDAADTGLPDERAGFLQQLQRLQIPVWAITGNHDYDNAGLNGYLLEINPALDIETHYGTHNFYGFSSGQDMDDGNHIGTLSESNSPDDSQLAWIQSSLKDDHALALFFHHPIYCGVFATIGTHRDELIAAVQSSVLRAVLVGHLHARDVYDGEGDASGLDLSNGTLPAPRWPLEYTGDRSTLANGSYGLHKFGTNVVEYHWIDL